MNRPGVWQFTRRGKLRGLLRRPFLDGNLVGGTLLEGPKIDPAASDGQLTSSAGLALLAALANWLDLPCQLARRVRVKLRRWGRADEQMLLSLIYAFCAGGGHLSDFDSLGRDRAALRYR